MTRWPRRLPPLSLLAAALAAALTACASEPVEAPCGAYGLPVQMTGDGAGGATVAPDPAQRFDDMCALSTLAIIGAVPPAMLTQFGRVTSVNDLIVCGNPKLPQSEIDAVVARLPAHTQKIVGEQCF